MVDNPDDIRPGAGAGEGQVVIPEPDPQDNPPVEPSIDDQTLELSLSEPGDETSPDGKPAPSKETPAEQRIKELTAKLDEYRPLDSLRELVREDPGVIDELRAARLRRRMGAPTEPAPVIQPAPQPSADDQAKVLAAWNDAFMKNPIGTVATLSKMIADEQSRTAAQPVRSLVTDLAIQNYKSRMRGDQLFAHVEKDFDAAIGSIKRTDLETKSAQELNGILEAAHLAAVGMAARRAFAEAQKAGTSGKVNPPRMGSSGGAGGAKKVRVSRDLYDAGKAAGLTDKEIAELAAEESR